MTTTTAPMRLAEINVGEKRFCPAAGFSAGGAPGAGRGSGAGEARESRVAAHTRAVSPTEAVGSQKSK